MIVVACVGGIMPLGENMPDLPDTVNHPAHYGGDTQYEAIKVIEAWGLGFALGNAVKYISRAGKKGDALEDLKKARWYLEREIARRQQVTGTGGGGGEYASEPKGQSYAYTVGGAGGSSGGQRKNTLLNFKIASTIAFGDSPQRREYTINASLDWTLDMLCAMVICTGLFKDNEPGTKLAVANGQYAPPLSGSLTVQTLLDRYPNSERWLVRKDL